MEKLRMTLVLLLCCNCVTCQHFSGGHISLGPSGFEHGLNITYRMTYTLDNLPCSSLNSTGQFLIFGGDTNNNSTCVEEIEQMDLVCTDYNSLQNWASVVGSGTLTECTDSPVIGVWYIGDPWVSGISVPGVEISSHLDSTLASAANISTRTDTGQINHSPITDMLPITINGGCEHNIVIPVYDAEDDELRCNTSGIEHDFCGDVCGFLNVTVHEEGHSFVMKYKPPNLTFKTVAALGIGDFDYNGEVRSLVSLQFLIFVNANANLDHCGEIPEFKDPTPKDNATIYTARNGAYKFRVFAGESNYAFKFFTNLRHYQIIEVGSVTSVLGNLNNETIQDRYRICFYARNEHNLYSHGRCIDIKVTPTFYPCNGTFPCSTSPSSRPENTSTTIHYCETYTDRNNNTWNFTLVNQTFITRCPHGFDGFMSRKCVDGPLFLPSVNNCTRKSLSNLTRQISEGKVNSSVALKNLSHLVASESKGSLVYAGDIDTLEKSLNHIVDNAQNGTVVGANETENFVNVVSFMLDTNITGNIWREKREKDGRGTGTILDTVDRFLMAAERSLPVNGSIDVEKSNIVLKVAAVNTSEVEMIHYPDANVKNNWTVSSVKLPTAAFAKYNVSSYSSVIYKNLSGTASTRLEGFNNVDTPLISQVISFQLFPQAPKILDPPLEMTFNLSEEPQKFEPHCVFWNSSLASGSGAWSSKGCVGVLSDQSQVTCYCNHLTNFAILMSPVRASKRHQTVLGIISIVGCSISMTCLVITIITLAIFWRHIQGVKTSLSMALCACLTLAYALFIGGVTRTENKDLCRAIAVVLHYIYLVVFFLMLAEGIHMTIQVAFPFHKKQHLKELLAMAFVTPAVIVAISMGLNLDGYGNDEYCWFKTGSWQFWTFAGPVLFVIAVNVVFIVNILVKLHGTAVMKSKDIQQKAKISAWTLGVLLPIMGVTWLLGVFSVSEGTSWIQYLFVTTNSLQGVGIFFFHCLFNKQLRKAIHIVRRRMQSMSDVLQKGSKSTPSTGVQFLSDTASRGSGPKGTGKIQIFLDDVKARATAPFSNKGTSAEIIDDKSTGPAVKFIDGVKYVPGEEGEEIDVDAGQPVSNVYEANTADVNKRIRRP